MFRNLGCFNDFIVEKESFIHTYTARYTPKFDARFFVYIWFVYVYTCRIHTCHSRGEILARM